MTTTEALNLKISMPEGRIEVRELHISCGFTELWVSYWGHFGDKPWVIRTSSNGPLQRQFGYATIEEARDEAWKSVGFLERLRLYQEALKRADFNASAAVVSLLESEEGQ